MKTVRQAQETAPRSQRRSGRPGAATAALRHTLASTCVKNTLRLPAAWVRPQREHCTTVPLSVAGTAWLGSAPYRRSTRTCRQTPIFHPHTPILERNARARGRGKGGWEEGRPRCSARVPDIHLPGLCEH